MTGSVTLTLPQPILCSPFVDGEISCSNNEVTIIGGCPPNSFVSYQWSNSETSPIITTLIPGIYTVTITDLLSGCTAVYEIEVTENQTECGAITGTVADDVDLDCLVGTGDSPLQNWMVKADGDTDFFALTGADGSYSMDVFVGDYNVEIIPPNPDFWDACQSPVAVSIEDETDVDTADFPMIKLVDCPSLEVDISTWAFRRCFETTSTVSYCNHGTATAEDAFVEITLDPLLELTSASIPYTGPVGNTYSFPLGDVGVGECGSFTVNIFTDCDVQLGQTLCQEAHIFPDSLCLPPSPDWTGATLELTAECDADSIFFTITNTGTGGTGGPVQYIVIEDGVMMMAEGPALGPGGSFTFAVPALLPLSPIDS